MRAIPAVFQDGRVFFQFTYPDLEGPVSVMVVFPGEVAIVDLEEQLQHLEEMEMEMAPIETPWISETVG